MTTASLTRKRQESPAAQMRRAQGMLRKLKETLEDLDDRMALAKAIKKNAGKPLHPWHEVAKELGIPAPPRKR
jgi:hypothetical protein